MVLAVAHISQSPEEMSDLQAVCFRFGVGKPDMHAAGYATSCHLHGLLGASNIEVIIYKR